MIFKLLFLCRVCTFLSGPVPTSSIQINYISVPPAVKNDSRTPVVLDCNYSLRPDDTDLVVKWYLNDDLVYQWIPSQLPRSYGLLKDRLDLEHAAGDDYKSVYRAMRIMNPTSELAGEYKCFVSTFTDEDFSIKNMIVFVPESSLDFYESDSSEESINFTCLASEVYPTPKLLIYQDSNDGFYNKIRLPTVEWDVTRHAGGRFSVYIIATAPVTTTPPGSILRCEIRIPGTGYVKIRSLLYYPQTLQETEGGAPNNIHTSIRIFLFLSSFAFFCSLVFL